MIDRRDLLVGAGCALALGAAEYLRPRRVLNLLGGADLARLVPERFGRWSSAQGGDIVVPQTEGSLSARLYGKQIVRTYLTPGIPQPVMLVIAYGSSQSDSLQLHRPESCYRAVGFRISARHLGAIALGGGVAVPGVALTAEAAERLEDIVYWTRLGEYLPQTASDQRRDRLAAAMHGYVGDGVLVRASMIRRPGEAPLYPIVQEFLAGLVRAMPAAHRDSLIGTALAGALADGGG